MMWDDERGLIEQILAGKKSSFEELMRMYNKKIFNFILRMVNDRELSSELTQDFFIKIYHVLDKYDKQYKFSTWAYRICYNMVIDHLRRKQAIIESLDDEDFNTKKLLDSDNYIAEDGLARLEKEELKGMIWKAVDRIPHKLRELILLRYIQGLKYEEIADVTDLPVGTVKNRIFKAKEILKMELMQHGLPD